MRLFAVKIAGLALVGVLVVGATMPVQASSLTSAQVSAVVNLLQAFGADASVIADVQLALGGQGTTVPSPVPYQTLIPASTQLGQSCATFSSNLYQGVSDTQPGGDVATLQSFLGISPTGYFGPITRSAVVEWQSTNGVSATGYVGPMTRAAIRCSTDYTSTSNGTIIGTVSGTISNPVPTPTSTSNPSFSATPTSGAAPLAVTFTTNGLDPTGQYIIEYGDGSNSGQITVPACMNVYSCSVSTNHTYTAAGIHTAILSPYFACLYSTPLCMVPARILGSVTVTVH